MGNKSEKPADDGEDLPPITQIDQSSMSYSQMLKAGHEQIVRAVIRPPRAQYSMHEMGPSKFALGSQPFERVDFEIKNKRRQKLQCSHWRPVEKETKKPRPCVVFLHGNAGCRLMCKPHVENLLRTGMTVMGFDFAGSGKSDGKYVSLGFFERDDLTAVIQHLRSSGMTSTIGLWGRSMGAATGIMYADSDPSVAGMILDSAYSDLEVLCTELVAKAGEAGMKIPWVAVKMAKMALARAVRKRAGLDIYKLKPITHCDKAFIPAMFMHASQDEFVAASHSKTLHKAYAGDKNIITFDGDHNSKRPQFASDSAAIFLKQALRVPDDLAIPFGTGSGGFHGGFQRRGGRGGYASHRHNTTETAGAGDDDMARAIAASLAATSGAARVSATSVSTVAGGGMTEAEMIAAAMAASLATAPAGSSKILDLSGSSKIGGEVPATLVDISAAVLQRQTSQEGLAMLTQALDPDS